MKWVFLALIVAMFLYEFVAMSNRAPGDTISEIIWKVTANYPILPFLTGFLCGHFFWQRSVG